MEIIPLGGCIGAEVRGLDLSQPMNGATFDQVHGAWLEHLVLVFRDQKLSDAQLAAFSGKFGELDKAPPNEAANKLSGAYVPDMPEITVISNIVENGVAVGALGADESLWHTDMSYNPVPPSASLLYSLEIPPVGGDTGFANMYAAYETLPSELKERIVGLSAIHDSTYTSAGGLRKGYEPVSDVTKAPGARHPIVRVHPETGKPALFLGRRRNSYIVGLPVEESERLLDQLWAHASRPEFQYTHQWRLGDLVMWDNRCTMHRRDGFDPNARRRLHRAQVKGTVPQPLAAQPA